jgi:hypothetical protein
MLFKCKCYLLVLVMAEQFYLILKFRVKAKTMRMSAMALLLTKL